MGSPVPIQPAAKMQKELEKLEIPDPRRAPWTKEFREMISLAVAQKEMPWVQIMGGWISATAGMVIDLETFMMWLIEEPQLAKKALALTAEYAYVTAESIVEDFGADTWVPWDGNPTDSNVLINAKVFEEFPLPYVKRLHKKMLDLGIPSIITHWCADHTQNIKSGHIEKIPNGDNGVLSFGPEVPMDVIVKNFGKKYNLLGNINPPLMMTSTYDEWLTLCKDNIEIGKEAKKVYALTVGCELPPPAPPSHVFAMTKAAELYGKY